MDERVKSSSDAARASVAECASANASVPVKVRDLTKVYGDNTAVNRVGFSLRQGTHRGAAS